MVDPWLSQWPEPSTGRHVVLAQAQVVDRASQLCRLAIEDSDGKQLAIQMPVSIVRQIVKSANEVVSAVADNEFESGS